MSENLRLQTPTIKDWLDLATLKLKKAHSPSPILDSEVILSNILSVDRTFLHAHYENKLNKTNLKKANKLLKFRQKRIPIAYIIGKKEFYNRSFVVTKSTLIPRPESEDIIEVLKQIFNQSKALKLPKNPILIDVGTGSGCLGITAKLELPFLNVSLLDISKKALKIAKQNSKTLSAKVKIINSNLLKNYKNNANIIIANLPYVDKKWERSPETDYEPEIALFADDNGKQLIKQLIKQSETHLAPNGFLIIEADPSQHKSLINYAKQFSLSHLKTTGFIVVFKKLD